MRIVDDQPQPVFQRGQVLQQPLHDRPAVQIRRRGQRPHQRRSGRRAPQRVGDRDPEPLADHAPRGPPVPTRRAGPGRPRRSRTASAPSSRSLPAPISAATRSASASRRSSARRDTTSPLTGGAAGTPRVPDSWADAVAPPGANRTAASPGPSSRTRKGLSSRRTTWRVASSLMLPARVRCHLPRESPGPGDE